MGKRLTVLESYLGQPESFLSDRIIMMEKDAAKRFNKIESALFSTQAVQKSSTRRIL